MKIKRHLVITDPAKFLAGEYDYCFSLYGEPKEVADWINCGDIELDIDVDTQQARDAALAELEEKERQASAAFTALMTDIERQKNELLAIENKPDLEVV